MQLDRTWIEQAAGRAVVDITRLTSGASRGMFLVYLADGDKLVLRLDAESGMMANTELTLGREAEVYRALTSRSVKIPQFVGISDDRKALLIQCVEGGWDLSAQSPDERSNICDRYIDSLADIHLLDTSDMDLPSFRRPKGPRDHALFELDLWQKILRDRVRQPAPLAECGFAILRELAPSYEGPPSLCHGDAGPKNFLFDKGEITALIDWEFAHLGDPIDDLAWWMYRGHEWIGAGGRLPDQLMRWSKRTGIAIDLKRLAYYRALVILRWHVLVTVAVENTSSAQDRLVYLQQVPLAQVRLASALAGLLGIDPGPPPELEGSAPLTAHVQSVIHGDLTDVILPALEDQPEAHRRAAALASYVDHFGAVDRFGEAVRSGDIADLTRFLGTRPRDISVGIADLAGRAGAKARDDFLIFSIRHALRHAHFWPATKARAFTPLWSIDFSEFTA